MSLYPDNEYDYTEEDAWGFGAAEPTIDPSKYSLGGYSFGDYNQEAEIDPSKYSIPSYSEPTYGGMGPGGSPPPTTGLRAATNSGSASSGSSGGTRSSGGAAAAATKQPAVPRNYQPMSLKLPTYKTPVYEEAVMGEMPTFAAPEYDESAIAKKTQKYAAPGVRKLRGAVQESMAKNFDNPNVKSMTLKNALSGYGEGLESVRSGAGRQASAEYAQEYAYKYKESGMNYATAVQAVRDKFQGQTSAKNSKFQAELNAVNMVYQAEIQKEQFRLAEESKKQMFDSIWASYEGKGNETSTNLVNTYGRGPR